MSLDAPMGDAMQAGGTPEASSSPAPVQSSQPQAAPQSQGAQGYGGQPQDGGGYQPQGDAGPGSIYDAFKQLPDFQGQDDYSIANALYNAHTGYQQAQSQLRQYQEALSEYASNRQRYQEWLQAQQQAQAPKPAEQPKWWNPPQVKDTWRSYIIRDPATGEEKIDPNAPFEARAAIQEYQAYTGDFAKRLVTDPENTLRPFVEQEAKKIAQEMVQQHLSQYQTQNYIRDLDRQHADWIYDQNGNITPRGRAAQAYIQEASDIGVSTPQARWHYALSMLQRDAVNEQYAQMQRMMQQAPPQGAPQQMPPQMPQQPQVSVQQERAPQMPGPRQRAARMPNRSGIEAPNVPQQRLTAEERLRRQLVKDGLI